MMMKRACVVSVVMALGCHLAVDDEDPSAHAEFEHDEIIEEIVENLRLSGYPEEEIDVVDGRRVFVGGDAEVSLRASREMIGRADRRGELRGGSDVDFRQYRTTNLVSTSVEVICVDGLAYSGTLGDALDDALDNYNALNLSFELVRTEGPEPQCDAMIEAFIMRAIEAGNCPKGSPAWSTA